MGCAASEEVVHQYEVNMVQEQTQIHPMEGLGLS